MSEMFRVLQPGGLAFVRVAAYSWMKSSHDEELGTQRRYRLSDLTQRMESVGFDVKRATYANSFLLAAAMLRRLVLKPIGLSEPGSDVKPFGPGWDWLNRGLTSVISSEAHLLKRTNLPFGLSAICIAQKPPAA